MEQPQADKKLSSTAAGEERRRSSRERAAKSPEVILEVQNPRGQTQVVCGKLVDISEHGVGIETVSVLPIGERVTITGTLLGESGSDDSPVPAQVIHCELQADHSYRSGLSFENQRPELKANGRLGLLRLALRDWQASRGWEQVS